MTFQLSPGVVASEIDLTTVVPSVSTTAGSFAGAFQWGPVLKRILISDENLLLKQYVKPDSNTYISFLTCASFLSYGNNLTVVRAANNKSFNATANSTANVGSNINNTNIFEASFLHQNNANTMGPFAARYPSALGNSLVVSVIDTTSNSANFASWQYASLFNGTPGTSAQVLSAGGANDELHVVVVDAGGLFTGIKGTVLETFSFVSKAINAKDSLGNSNYYKEKIFNESTYIYATDPVSFSTTSATWGQPMANTSYAVLSSNVTSILSGGTDAVPTTADLVSAYALFTSVDDIDISLVITGGADTTTQQYVIDNVAEGRKDCVAFISPPSANVINQAGLETTNITTWLNGLSRSSSYTFVDSGWKYMFDKYNNTFRWVPLNGDMAGLCVITDTLRDAWWSPAGLNRGNVKNLVKLAWNPTKTMRDVLYSKGVNPVVSFPGSGTFLYGDKTLQTKPSAFDRINVRRLFIVLEKAISRAAKYSMFEFNDEFTRAQFVALVTPYLRDVQGRRGVTDYRVVCDTTNNTGQVIDNNQFVGDIYVKPSRSINFIQLNFVAVGTGVDFTEIVGSF